MRYLSILNYSDPLFTLWTTDTLGFPLLLLLSPPKLLYLFYPMISSLIHLTISLISSAVFLPPPACSFHPRKTFPFQRCLPLLSHSWFASHPLSPVPQLCQRKSSMKNVLTLHNCHFPHVSYLLDTRVTCLLNWCLWEMGLGTCTEPPTLTCSFVQNKQKTFAPWGQCFSFKLRSSTRGLRAWGVLRSILAFPRTVLFWTEISYVVPRICWSHSNNFFGSQPQVFILMKYLRLPLLF